MAHQLRHAKIANDEEEEEEEGVEIEEVEKNSTLHTFHSMIVVSQASQLSSHFSSPKAIYNKFIISGVKFGVVLLFFAFSSPHSRFTVIHYSCTKIMNTIPFPS